MPGNCHSPGDYHQTPEKLALDDSLGQRRRSSAKTASLGEVDCAGTVIRWLQLGVGCGRNLLALCTPRHASKGFRGFDKLPCMAPGIGDPWRREKDFGVPWRCGYKRLSLRTPQSRGRSTRDPTSCRATCHLDDVSRCRAFRHIPRNCNLAPAAQANQEGPARLVVPIRHCNDPVQSR
jgi:hypothetical protein